MLSGKNSSDPSASLELLLSGKETQLFRKRLLTWYQKHHRKLPWREQVTPYGVWVSEVMLQQTRVEVVRDYYSRWMDKFPTLLALAQAKESEVLHLWQGLGYYSRARRLRTGAQFVQSHFAGELPPHPAQLLTIPGIGPYSAGAISSIAFGLPSAIVDGNVIRVLCRYFALAGDPNKAQLKRLLWELAGRLVAPEQPSAFNQGLMELGATVCTPKSPLCHACPLRKSCAALSQAGVTRYPELPKPKEKTSVTLAVLVLRVKPKSKQGSSCYGFMTLPSEARWWANLDVFPFCEAPNQKSVQKSAAALAERYVQITAPRFQILEPVRHTVTRFELQLVPVVIELEGRPPLLAGLNWVDVPARAQLALPSAHRKVLDRLDLIFGS